MKVFCDPIHIARQQHEEVEIDRVAEVQARCDSSLWIEKLRIGRGANERVQFVQRPPIRAQRWIRFVLFITTMAGVGKIGRMIDRFVNARMMGLVAAVAAQFQQTPVYAFHKQVDAPIFFR